jgi:hypothetical protein
MRALRRLQRRFRLMRLRFVAWLRSLGSRIRRQFSDSQQELNAETDPVETLRTDPTPAGLATTVVSRERHPPQPRCHWENKFRETCFQRLSLLPVFEHDPPKEEIFVFFPNLPAELRLQVWQYVASFERVVEIQGINRTIGIRHGASPRPPAILHVCHESRYEALKVYKLCCGTKRLPKSIYLNPASDIIFFRVKEQIQIWQYILGPHALWREQLKHVRRIAMGHTSTTSLRFMKKMVCSFPHLEELIILWAEDAYKRPYEGRATNYIESAPGHTDNRRYSYQHSAMIWKATIVAAWDGEQWWRKLGRDPPAVSVRHWCMRSDSEG